MAKNKKKLKVSAEVFTVENTMICDECGMMVKLLIRRRPLECIQLQLIFCSLVVKKLTRFHTTIPGQRTIIHYLFLQQIQRNFFRVPGLVLERAIDIEFPASISGDGSAMDSSLPLHIPEYQNRDVDSPDDDPTELTHAQRHLGYRGVSIGDDFYLRANTCSGDILGAGKMACIECEALPSHKQLEGILRRIDSWLGGNCTVTLRLNGTRTIGRKMAAIDDYKELTMAIASGKMARVGNLLESDLANHAGVRRLVGICLRTSVDKVRAAHDAANMAVGLLLLRLGGSCVAEISHRALGLPSVSTLRRHPTIRPLLPSPGMPIVEEIESNIDSCLDATAEFSATQSQGPEIATEKRVRYDDRNNKVATVAALGALSKNPREYSARPIFFSSDCEKESEAEQAGNFLRPLVTAMNNKSEHRNTKFRLVSVASDGESRRGTAFAKEYHYHTTH
ncbi:hypothetical protein B0H13DRAFT_1902276 [Mycena leptocephala]|nr:hypothetical protein B0H13DRAFT_1902276 [Mycena leptocephala]